MIAVLGATGRIGHHVAARLAEQSVEARALVRDPSRADLPLDTVGADLRDASSLFAALDGVEQLFLLTPHGADQEALEANAVDAAKAAGVRRIVKVSGGAPSLGPNGPSATSVAHWRSERRIEDSGMAFCFLRPSFLMQNLLETVAPMVAKAGVLMAPMGHGPIAMVDARDVADCAVAALLNPEAPDQAWHVTGPRPVTFDDLAAALGVPYFNLPPRLAAVALHRGGASAFDIEHSLRMAAYFATGADGAPTPAVAQLTGRPPRTLDAFLSEHAGVFAGPRLGPITRLLSLRPQLKGI
jgi:uncharacterized protein YbjT (DUF2867 family)